MTTTTCRRCWTGAGWSRGSSWRSGTGRTSWSGARCSHSSLLYIIDYTAQARVLHRSYREAKGAGGLEERGEPALLEVASPAWGLYCIVLGCTGVQPGARPGGDPQPRPRPARPRPQAQESRAQLLPPVGPASLPWSPDHQPGEGGDWGPLAGLAVYRGDKLAIRSI